MTSSASTWATISESTLFNHMKYVHFTSKEDAEKIKSSGFLLPSSIVGGIYAVAVGGYASPGVQQTNLGRASNRDVAVVFKTDELPDRAYPEEVIWHMGQLPIQVLDIISSEEAFKLLDNSRLSGDNEILDIPTHPLKPSGVPGEYLREFIRFVLKREDER